VTLALTHSPIQLATKTEILDAKLFFVEGALVAVVSNLSAAHNSHAGRWFIEAAFGRLNSKDMQTFASLDEVEQFIRQRYD
jgi:hypothetical protein